MRLILASLLAISASVYACAVPDVTFSGYGADGSVDVGVGDDGASADGATADGDDSSLDGGSPEASCGAASCCGPMVCIGDCSDANCALCASKCSGSQQCCVKQTVTCRPLGTACP